MSSSVEAFQITPEQAQYYESKFVPALFGEWASHVVDAAGLGSGDSVLDVACGTGVVAREVAGRLAGNGRVVGLDLNEGMLTVARRLRSDIEWQQGDVAELPFASASFDVALCQAALMFFPDRAKALREMARVVKPSGKVVLQVFGRLEDQPAYRPLVDTVARHAGPKAIELMGTYWACGDLDLVTSLFEAAGLEITGTHTRLCTLRFDSVDEAVRTEVESTPLIDLISDEVYDLILEESRTTLREFTTPEGRLEAPIQGHVIVGRKP